MIKEATGHTVNQLDEPVALSAPMARRLARRLCRKDPATGEDCSWYHGLWQDLRALGLAADPGRQADFFRAAFRRLAGRRRLRVLVSGAADYSILAHVMWNGQAFGLALEITVVDVCDTPLFLNRWYAEQTRQAITTAHADIFTYQTDSPFDLVCGHSFLGQFAPEERTRLVRKWSQLLAPGGTVLAVNRVRPRAAQQDVRFTSEQARAFCASVEQRIRHFPSLTESDQVEILDRARIYTRRLHVYAMTGDDLTSLFRHAGFRIEGLSGTVSGKPDRRGVTGLAVPANAEHMCIMASWETAGSQVPSGAC